MEGKERKPTCHGLEDDALTSLKTTGQGKAGMEERKAAWRKQSKARRRRPDRGSVPCLCSCVAAMGESPRDDALHFPLLLF